MARRRPAGTARREAVHFCPCDDPSCTGYAARAAIRWVPNRPSGEKESDMTSQQTTGRFLDVKGGQVRADIREGAGPVLIFLHYWGGSRRTWGPVLERLDPGQGFVAY